MALEGSVELPLPVLLQEEIADHQWLAGVEKFFLQSQATWLYKQDGSRQLQPQGVEVVVISQG